MTLLGSGASTEEETRVWTEDGDHERYAHYAPADEVTYALIEGVPIMALCGKIWIPNRDPKKFPVCPTCKEIYDGLSND
jgi:uncharacterized protein YbaR (Trm112 family)